MERMTEARAKALVGNQSSQSLKNMVKALSFHPWSNTPEDTERLSAAKYLLRKRRQEERKAPVPDGTPGPKRLANMFKVHW